MTNSYTSKIYLKKKIQNADNLHVLYLEKKIGVMFLF